MKTRMLLALLLAVVAAPWTAAAKEKKPTGPPTPIGWLHISAGSRSFTPSETDSRKKVSRDLPLGALLPVFRTGEKHGVTSGQVGTLNLASGSSELGWVEMTPAELKPVDSYPPDSELLRLLGAPYLDDFVAENTDVARFLVRQTQGPPALLCYVLSMPLSAAKLVVFVPSEGKYELGANLDVTIGELRAGITSLEIRDMVGDGDDCVISREHFREQAQTNGITLRIRRIAGGQFQSVWQAPIKFRNLSQFSPKMQILRPPEQNIGAPGTVTTGEVTFLSSGKGQEPVWKGKVEFFVFGREKAYDSVNIEKACPWDGREFAPLQ